MVSANPAAVQIKIKGEIEDGERVFDERQTEITK
jgi:hypothetical protein